jgi:lysosomal alpha-mannosidase
LFHAKEDTRTHGETDITKLIIPFRNFTKAFKTENHIKENTFSGDIVDEIHQTFSSWISQVVRIYKQENHVEFEWLVGPIPIE